MSGEEKKLMIDARTGGNGEMWMRLVAFYAVAGLRPEFKIHVLMPEFLRKIGDIVFGDRLVMLSDEDAKDIKVEFTNLGFKDLIPKLGDGKTYVSPIQRTAARDKKGVSKGRILMIDATSFLFDSLGLIHIPKFKWAATFSGFLEMVAYKPFRFMDYEMFIEQTKKDYQQLYDKLNGPLPLSPEFSVPADLKDHVLIFPTGTSRQFMPVEWAVKHFPNAYYAIFYRDKKLQQFADHGLKTVPFYKEPGDLVELSKAARWTILTDSFHSHIIQSANERSTVLITELLAPRVVNPAYRGKIVDSVVTCHPCIHMTGQPTCAMGHTNCLNWGNAVYTNNIVRSVPAVSVS